MSKPNLKVSFFASSSPSAFLHLSHRFSFFRNEIRQILISKPISSYASLAHKTNICFQMTTQASKRLMRDFEKMMKEDDGEEIIASPEEESNIFKWKAVIIGPKDTIW